MTATKTKTTKATTGGLRKPQVRILQALTKHGEMSRKDISAKAPCDLAWLTEWIGSSDPATRKANDKKSGCVSLLTLGYVTAADSDEGPAVYTITAAGKKALAAAKD